MADREVAPGIHRFGDDHVNWYVLEDKGALTVIDGGMPAHWSQLLDWLARRAFSLDAVKAVVLTHGHADHLGIVERLRRETDALVHVHEADRPLSRGIGLRRPPRRIVRNLWRPHNLALFVAWARDGVLRVPPVLHASAFGDGQVLDVPGGLRVVHTPGHSAGSSTLIARDGAVALTGDALVTLDVVTGRRGVGIMPGKLNDDPAQALASLDNLKGVGARIVLPGHGRPWADGLPDALNRARRAGIDWRDVSAHHHGHDHATP
ncbi:MBL fold metallo-hydrolase [Spongiactinospora gelatinilytica]|uniref:MBL fold metallo-hydrolase n=1 Tax=Spongiactinospora gelatinilytica TaxID=2666298 RepID=UPI001F210A1E|nr:MBL fold metallo-hydrolase [Spongiactinospora gelatinilytica]